MGSRRRSPAEKARDAQQIAALYLQGYSQTEIAARLNLGVATVCRDLKPYHERWQEEARRDIATRKAEQLAQLDQLLREYWEAWERSKAPRKVSTVSKAAGGNGDGSATVRSEERTGDPRFLEGVRWCMERRAKLLGLDAPTRTEHTGADGRAIEVQLTWAQMVAQAINDLPEAENGELGG